MSVAATDPGGGATIVSMQTANDGSYSLIVPAGAMDLVVTKAYYTSPAPIRTGVAIGRTVNVSVSMSEAATGKPTLAVTAPGDDVGFGASVTLTASATDPNGDTLAYAWSNATWPLLGSVTGTGTSGTVTLPSMIDAFAYRPDSTNPGQFISGYILEDRFGIVPILSDTRGQMSVKVTAADGHGQSAAVTMTLNAASVVGGVHAVAIGTRVYVNSGHDTASSWTLTRPSGSTAALSNAASRTPSFVADVAGKYTLVEGANTMDIEAGTWRGAIGGGTGDSVTADALCTGCHKSGGFAHDLFTPWLQTGHATQLTRGINGKLGAFYSEACISCHTVGHDSGVASGGFDDVAKTAGWTFPGTLAPTNWSTMVATAPTVARLANIQCESCHGPQNSAVHGFTRSQAGVEQPFLSPRIAYSSENCATCHGAGAHHIYSEWATPAASGMGHSNRDGATTIGSGATGLNSSCGRCHTAQGYTLYADLLGQGKVALNTVPAATLAMVTPANAEPVTCVACHDPHSAGNPNQLRFYGDTPNLPGGFAGHGMGKGALCLTCHNSRNGAQTGSDALTFLHEDGEPYNAGNPTGYSAPHQAAQGDVFTGHNAYFLGAAMPMTSRHAAIEDTCVGCHMTLQPKGYVAHGSPAQSGHLFRIEDGDLQTLCANCHGANVNGEGIQASVEAQIIALETKLGGAAKTRINNIAGGKIRVRAYDASTDYYSSTSSGSSNVTVDVGINPVTKIDVVENHGQIALELTFTQPVLAIPFVTGAGAPAPSKDMQTFQVQLGSLKDNATTPAVLYALSGNYVRAGWNYFLIEGDQSKGLHNPTFVNAVLNASLAKDLSF